MDRVCRHYHDFKKGKVVKRKAIIQHLPDCGNAQRMSLWRRRKGGNSLNDRNEIGLRVSYFGRSVWYIELFQVV